MNRKEEIITRDIIALIMNIDSNEEYVFTSEVRGNQIRYLVVKNNVSKKVIDECHDYDELGQWFRLSIYAFAGKCKELCESLGYSIKSGRNENGTFYAFLKSPEFGEQEKEFYDTEDDDLAIINATKSILC